MVGGGAGALSPSVVLSAAAGAESSLRRERIVANLSGVSRIDLLDVAIEISLKKP